MPYSTTFAVIHRVIWLTGNHHSKGWTNTKVLFACLLAPLTSRSRHKTWKVPCAISIQFERQSANQVRPVSAI